jgi:hypothetical protein
MGWTQGLINFDLECNSCGKLHRIGAVQYVPLPFQCSHFMFQHSYFNPTVIKYMVASVDYYFVDYTKSKVCQNLFNIRVRIDNIRKKFT